MPSYYSPTGNFEVWAEKPADYLTPEEWLALHPPVVVLPPEPTLDELKAVALAEIKATLASTDYLTLKAYDGALSEDEYVETRTYRASLRAIYNTVETATEISQITAIWPEVG